MASGSISKHVAKDGKTTWRVRVDVYAPLTNRRRQPQRTYPTKREAERSRMIKGVVDVRPVAAHINDEINRQRLRREMAERLWAALEDKA